MDRNSKFIRAERSLIGGMNLGRVIRAHGLITHVGQKGPMADGFQHTVEGHCMSAAALASLGGEFRYVKLDICLPPPKCSPSLGETLERVAPAPPAPELR